MTGRRDTAAHVFVDDLGADGPIELPDDAAHHLTRVLRLRDGEAVGISDGRGGWRRAIVVRASEDIRLDPAGPAQHEPRLDPPLTLATAIPKGDRLDWLVQKATEVGVDRIMLLDAERSVTRWKTDRVERQLLRLQRIADEAARQSRRLWRVDLAAPVPATTVLPHAAVAEPGGRPLAATDALIAVGPEGGWTPAELETTSVRIDLGPNILRTETAGIVAIALSVASRHRILGLGDELV